MTTEAPQLNADARIKLTIGTQFVENNILQDQIVELRKTIADQVDKMEAMKQHVPTKELAKIFAAAPVA